MSLEKEPKTVIISQLFFVGLLSNPAPIKALIGISFIIFFAIVEVIICPDYELITF